MKPHKESLGIIKHWQKNKYGRLLRHPLAKEKAHSLRVRNIFR